MILNSKLILFGVTGALVGYFLAAMVGTVKLISIGDSTWRGSTKILGLPVMYIDANSQSYYARADWGVFVLATIGAIFAVLYAATRKKTHPRK